MLRQKSVDIKTAQELLRHPLRSLQGHTGWMNGVSVTTDGNLAVSASADNTLRMWDLVTGQSLGTLDGH